MEMGKALQGKETAAKSARSKREQLYLQPEAYLEPRMGTVSPFSSPCQVRDTSKLTLWLLSPKCSAQGSKFHLWIAGRAGIGNSAPQAASKSPLTRVYPICLCTGDSAVPVCWRGYPGLPRTGRSQYVGGAAGVVLAGKEGWQLANLRPVAWTESFPLCGTGAQH